MTNNIDRDAVTKQLPAPLHLPAVTMTDEIKYPPTRRPEHVDLDYLLDVAVAASQDGRPLTSNVRLLEMICEELGSTASWLSITKDNLSAAKAEIATLKAALAAEQARLADMAQERDVALLQLEVELAENMRLTALHAKVSGENAALRRSQVEVAFERVTVTITGGSTEQLTAELNEQIRAHAAAPSRMFDLSEDDTEVIEIDLVAGIPVDHRQTQRIERVSMFEQVYGVAKAVR